MPALWLDRIGSDGCGVHRSVQFGGGYLGVKDWDDTSGAISANGRPGAGAFSVADPRAPEGAAQYGQYGVQRMHAPMGAVINVKAVGQGGFSVADPRIPGPSRFNNVFRIVPWKSTSPAVAGPNSADLRVLPELDNKLVAVIRALDGTWHRPFTTLELAALQSLFDPDEWFGFEMDGMSDSAWRERIGNAVPPDAAVAVAGVIGRTLLLAWSGETFLLSSDPIWVQPLTVALSVDTPEATA